MRGTTSAMAVAEAEAEAVPVPVPVPAMEEERHVKVASRFFRVNKQRRDDGGSSTSYMASLHYLGSCFLCKKDISCNRDVFMYKGDAAFCSENCRDDQMDMDEALHAVARRHRLLLSSSSHSQPADASIMMRRRRPTIANLAADNPPVAAS